MGMVRVLVWVADVAVKLEAEVCQPLINGFWVIMMLCCVHSLMVCHYRHGCVDSVGSATGATPLFLGFGARGSAELLCSVTVISVPSLIHHARTSSRMVEYGTCRRMYLVVSFSPDLCVRNLKPNRHFPPAAVTSWSVLPSVADRWSHVLPSVADRWSPVLPSVADRRPSCAALCG